MKSISLTLPYPPSSNRYWHSTARHGFVQVLLTREAKAYKAQVGLLARGHEPLEGPLELVLKIYRPRKAGDLSNRFKVLEDALQGYLFHDDKQVVHIDAWRFDDKDDPRAEVVVSMLDPVAAMRAARDSGLELGLQLKEER